GDYVRILRRRRLFIAATVAVVLVSAVGLSFLQSKRYTSTAKVLVKPVNDPFQSQAPVGSLLSMDTERQLASSFVVAELAGKTIDPSADPQDLLDHLSVGNPTNTQVLDISYAAPTPAA